MKVAFDGAPLGDGPITGVARAFLNALAPYAAGALAHGDHVFLLLPAGAADPALPGVEVVRAPRGALRRQLALPRLLRRLGADLLHSPVAAVPLRAPCPTIATVHDLPWLHPESGETASAWRRFATRRSLRAAAAVIAPSRFTLADVQALLGSDDRRVRLIPHGCHAVWPPPESLDAERRRGPLLVLGDDRPRKNRARVRAAHAQARERCPDLPALRFVGPPDAYVDEDEKQRLLRSCRALVQCSLFEGFGLPVLEGLACGAPLLCADIPPFHELAGDRALFVDPRDIAAIAAGMVRIHIDAALRGSLVQPDRGSATFAQADLVARQWRELHAELLA